jgi:acetyltransferase-like isoleucine patch superfamily enzyme
MIVGQHIVNSQHTLVQLPENVRIHPTSEIDPSVDLGAGTVVWAYAVLLGGIKTGRDCSIGAGTQIMRDVRMGDACRIGAQVHLTNRMQLGNRVFVAPMAVFADDRHPQVNNPRYRCEPPCLEDDVAVGVGAVVLPGVVLGQGCTVGAGAVVTRSVAPWTTVVGNPARPLRPLTIEHPLTGELVSLEGL